MRNLKPLSRELLLSKGKCCKNGCTNCPYFPKASGSSVVFSIPDKVNCYPSCNLEAMQKGLCMCYLEFKTKNRDE